MKISPEKVREVIGKGGATIRALTEETHTTIDISDDGVIKIAAVNALTVRKRSDVFSAITAEVELDKIYEGPVVKIADFGAFVEVLPGRQGLLHISQIRPERVNDVRDYPYRRANRESEGHRNRSPRPSAPQHEGAN